MALTRPKAPDRRPRRDETPARSVLLAALGFLVTLRPDEVPHRRGGVSERRRQRDTVAGMYMVASRTQQEAVGEGPDTGVLADLLLSGRYLARLRCRG
jgi:hypothetical protein